MVKTHLGTSNKECCMEEFVEEIVPRFIRDWLLEEDKYVLKESSTGEEKQVTGKDLYDTYDDESIYKAWTYGKSLTRDDREYLLLDSVA